MPKSPLNIQKIKFPEIASGRIGVDKNIKEFAKGLADYLKLIADDFSMIINEGLAQTHPQDLKINLFIPLEDFYKSIQKLPKSLIKETFQQQLRYFSLFIKNRLDQITDADTKTLIGNLLKGIDNSIGVVPKLNESIPLPSRECLPPEFEKSIQDWKATLIESPTRDKIRFFTKKTEINKEEVTIASVRLHLIALDVNTKNENEALSCADADILPIGDLQADHLQPSEQIIERQKEMLEAMSIDPIFANEMEKHPDHRSHFRKKDNLYVGTKYFYVVYHNCIDNLWLIRPSANSGMGKGAQDPIEWLRSHERFGMVFLNFLGGEAAINKSTILFTTPKGMLAHAARGWFLSTYHNEIAAAGFLRAEVTTHITKIFHELALEKLKESSDSETKKQSSKTVNAMASLVMAQSLAQMSSSSADSGSASPLLAGSTNINDQTLALMKEAAKPADPVLREKRREITTRYKEQYRLQHAVSVDLQTSVQSTSSTTTALVRLDDRTNAPPQLPVQVTDLGVNLPISPIAEDTDPLKAETLTQDNVTSTSIEVDRPSNNNDDDDNQDEDANLNHPAKRPKQGN